METGHLQPRFAGLQEAAAERFDKMLGTEVDEAEDVSKKDALYGGAYWTEIRTFALAFRLAA
ncbi:MAG: hypothetical protein D4R82_04715 [Dehalococcoidia bacterium]|nr:MAG: hypothetical protein D4R82_04715 [Dehalococcoidia bacterium]